MPPKSLLVVEDQVDLADMVRYNLEREGYRVQAVNSGTAALVEIGRHAPDLILLDRMLPGVAGDEIIAQLKRNSATASIPVIMMTAKAEETDELVGFALGADDYITKPFSMKLLLARVGAMLRRAESVEAGSDILSIGPIRLDASRHDLTVDGRSTPVTATEFRVLKTLMAANGRVLSRAQMIDNVLGPGVAVTDRSMDVHITALRKKLGSAADWVQTIRGVGYTFREPT